MINNQSGHQWRRRKLLWLILCGLLAAGLIGCSSAEASQSTNETNGLSLLQTTIVPDIQLVTPSPATEVPAAPEIESPTSDDDNSPPATVTTDSTEVANPAAGPDTTSSISSYLGADLQSQRIDGTQSAAVTALAFSPDSTTFAVAYSNGSIDLIQGSGEDQIQTLDGHSATVRDLAFSPDGTALASAGEDSRVMIWDISDGSLTQTIDTSFVGRALAVEYSPDGSKLAVGGHKCFVALYAPWSGILNRTLVQPSCSLKQGGSVEYWELSYSPDGSQLITAEGQPSGSEASIQSWTLDPLSPPVTVKGFGLGISSMVIAPDRSWIALSLIGSSRILMIDAGNGRITNTLEGHLNRVNSLDVSPDGRILASGSTDGTVRLWDTRSGLLLRDLTDQSAAVTRVAFSPDGTVLASGSADGSVILWSFSSPGA